MRPADRPKRNKRWKDSARRREPGQFLALPYGVLRSEEWGQLSPAAVKLAMDLAAQFNGQNNGDLAATWNAMKRRGWRSKDTLYRAIAELRDREWIVKTRQGGRTHKPTLYALTFLAIDYCDGKLEVKTTSTPLGSWRRYRKSLDLTPVHFPKDPAAREVYRERYAREKQAKDEKTSTATVPMPPEIAHSA